MHMYSAKCDAAGQTCLVLCRVPESIFKHTKAIKSLEIMHIEPMLINCEIIVLVAMVLSFIEQACWAAQLTINGP